MTRLPLRCVLCCALLAGLAAACKGADDAGADDAGGAGGAGGEGPGGSGGDETAGNNVAGNAGAGGIGGEGDTGGMPAVDHFVYVSGTAENISGFKFDVLTGKVSPGPGNTAAGAEIYNPTYLAFHPSGTSLYASDELGFNVGALAIERGTGNLTPLSAKDAGGSGNVHVFVHPGGKWLFSSNYNGANVRVFPIKAGGDMGDSVDMKATGAGSHQIMASRDGKYAFVPCRGPNQVFQFRFDVAEGKLTPNDPPTVASDDPRHIAMHPDGKHAYLVNEKPDNGDPANVVVFDLDAGGRLAEKQKVVLDQNERWGAHIEVTPDGKYVYASGRDNHKMYVFSVNATDGKLTAAGNFDGKGLFDEPRDFTIAPGGKYLVVAGASTSQIVVLEINSSNGSLKKVGEPVKAAAASTVVVVPLPRP